MRCPLWIKWRFMQDVRRAPLSQYFNLKRDIVAIGQLSGDVTLRQGQPHRMPIPARCNPADNAPVAIALRVCSGHGNPIFAEPVCAVAVWRLYCRQQITIADTRPDRLVIP